MNRLLGLHIAWIGWATAFTAEFVLFNRHRIENYDYRWTLWLGPLKIFRRAGGTHDPSTD